MSLTCISCKLLFSVPQLHQEHYKSDWHRYNLKRRLAELPPLSQEEYEKRAAAFQADSEKTPVKTSLKCGTCNKHFSSQNAMISHLKSKKHLEMVSKEGSQPKKDFFKKPNPQVKEKPNEETQPSTAEDGINKDNDDDEEWSDDDGGGDWESCEEDDEEDGEIKKVIIDTNDCLFCDHQSDSAVNNVTHMTEAHSFFIPDVEYLSDLDGLIASLAAKIYLNNDCLWCDGKGKGFRSVKSVKQHMIDKGHCKMLHEGEALLYYADFYDYSKIGDAKPEDSDIMEDILEDADYELVLPSGATIGHRSLAIYYKQNLKPVASDNQQKVRKVIQQYKSLGYTGCTGQLAVKKAKDISYVKWVKDRYNLKMSLKTNKFQPHFRRQVMF